LVFLIGYCTLLETEINIKETEVIANIIYGEATMRGPSSEATGPYFWEGLQLIEMFRTTVEPIAREVVVYFTLTYV